MLAIVRTRVLVAGGHQALGELRATNAQFELVGHVRSLDGAQEAMRSLRPSVLVLDCELTHRRGLCSLPALRRASPETAIVLPPAREPGPRLVRAVRMAARNSERRREVDGLTPRERDIVRLVALGHTNREIADRLVLSVRTVETHRGRIRARLAVSSRAELVRWALDRGLLAP
jgi:two-component system, NarL family, response regulator NreC